jgi:hypothetical protein
VHTVKNKKGEKNMAQLIADRRDIDFVIWEQLNGEELLKYDVYSDFNKKTCDMILTEARKLAINFQYLLKWEGRGLQGW